MAWFLRASSYTAPPTQSLVLYSLGSLANLLKANQEGNLMAHQSTRQFLKAASALAMGLVLAACSKQEAPAPATDAASAPAAASTPAEKVFAVGTDATYAPFEFQNEKAEIVGFSVDLLNAVAEKGGFKVKFINTPWEGIFNALNQGDRDLLISSITITDERKQTMDFSDPYFDAAQLIAVKGDSKVAKFDDLKKLKVGVQTGTTGDEVVTKLQGKTSTLIKRFESTPLALQELQAGGVDAVVADNGVVIHYVANNPDAKFKTVSDTAFAPEHYGIAVKKGNAELLAMINKGLAAVKADGTYAAIYKKTFGTEPPAAAADGAASAASH
jgi:polar amino acid transport system substrate-binding protein